MRPGEWFLISVAVLQGLAAFAYAVDQRWPVALVCLGAGIANAALAWQARA